MLRKTELPKAVTDLLGIPPIQKVAGPWLSNEGTVTKEWFQAVAEAFGLPYTGKVSTMKAILEYSEVAWNPLRHSSVITASEGGGNVRKEAFADLLTALETSKRTQVLASAADQTPFEEPTGTPPEDADERVLRAIRVRRGQPWFRAQLLEAYGGKCALTGVDAADALEAAHIRPHSGGGTYATSNGLLLRGDLHTLFDLGLIGFDPVSGAVLLHNRLAASTYGKELGRLRLRRPTKPHDRPDPMALREHNERFGLS
jgi:HNH endonuclease